MELFGSHIPPTDINSFPFTNTHIVEVMTDKRGFSLVQNNKMLQQGKYEIFKSKSDDKTCLDGSDSSGTIKFKSCHEGEEQGWKTDVKPGGSFFTIKSVSELGKCWSFLGGKLSLKDCNGKDEQSFKINQSNPSLLTPKTTMVYETVCAREVVDMWNNNNCLKWENTPSCKKRNNTCIRRYTSGSSNCQSWRTTSTCNKRYTSGGQSYCDSGQWENSVKNKPK